MASSGPEPSGGPAYAEVWRERRLAAGRRWKERNRTVTRVTSAMWKWVNPEEARAHRKATRARHLARNYAYLDSVKMASGCVLCSYRGAPEALDFDHIDPSSKEFAIGKSMLFNLDRIKREVAKCRVLCSNCHRIESKRLGHCGRKSKG